MRLGRPLHRERLLCGRRARWSGGFRGAPAALPPGAVPRPPAAARRGRLAPGGGGVSATAAPPQAEEARPWSLPPSREPGVGDHFVVAAAFRVPGGGLALTLRRADEGADSAGVVTLALVHVERVYGAGVWGPLLGRLGPAVEYPLPAADARR